MRVVKIIATYDQDEKQNIVLIGRQNSDGRLDDDFEYFGYVTDWTQESNNYLRYPFTMDQMENQDAIIQWGGWDQETTTVINIYQRRVVVGEKLIRKDNNEQSEYTVSEVSVIV